MRVITCASYYGTGSSAVTDYVTEFSKVKSLGIPKFGFSTIWTAYRTCNII